MKWIFYEFIALVIFLAIWILGCATEDYFFDSIDHSYIMAWGFLVGLVGHIFADAIRKNR